MEVIALSLSASQIKIDKIVISFFVLMFFTGCSGDLKSTKKDPFFEKWSTLAENSQGHSPEAKTKKIDITTASGRKATTAEVTGETARKLPTRPITLTMHHAELKAALRAMAKSVDYNLLVKDDLKGEVSVDFRAVPWDQAFTGLLKTHSLSYTWEGSIIRVKTSEDDEKELKQKVQLHDIQGVEQLLTVVVPIDYAIDEDDDNSVKGQESKGKDANRGKALKENLESLLTRSKDDKPRGSIRVDLNTNSLIISATQEDLTKIMKIIETIDKPRQQILIKANIVETTKSVARDLGVMWGGLYKGNLGNKNIYVTPGGTSGTGDPISGGYTSTQATGIGGQGFASNFPISGIANAVGAASLGLIYGVIGESLLEVQLQALQQDSKLNILSSPSITTLDNQLAFTENGAKSSLCNSSTFKRYYATPTYTTNFVDVVMRLEITPHVIDGKNLKMTIFVQKDDMDLTRKDSLGDPYIIKKQTKTDLIVKDGETIVISGLTKQTRSDGYTGWPLLKDIPVLGWLFKADSKNDTMEEVLIFITPHILQVADVNDKSPAPVQGKDQLEKTKSN